MKRTIFTLLMIVWVVVVAVAQDSISDRYTMPKGRWSLDIDWHPYNMGWTYQDVTGKMDFSGFALLGLGLGAEYAYRDNRTLRLDAQAALVGHYNFTFGCLGGEKDRSPERVVNSVSVNLTHLFYRRHWMGGGGLAFEYRHVDYATLSNSDGILGKYLTDRSILRKCGTDSYDLMHYSMGLTLMGAYRITPNCYVGVRYSPSLILGSKFRYKKSDVALLGDGVARKGHVEHHLWVVAGFRIDLTKGAPKRSRTARKTVVDTTPETYIDNHGRKQSTGVVRPKQP